MNIIRVKDFKLCSCCVYSPSCCGVGTILPSVDLGDQQGDHADEDEVDDQARDFHFSDQHHHNHDQQNTENSYTSTLIAFLVLKLYSIGDHLHHDGSRWTWSQFRLSFSKAFHT